MDLAKSSLPFAALVGITRSGMSRCGAWTRVPPRAAYVCGFVCAGPREVARWAGSRRRVNSEEQQIGSGFRPPSTGRRRRPLPACGRLSLNVSGTRYCGCCRTAFGKRGIIRAAGTDLPLSAASSGRRCGCGPESSPRRNGRAVLCRRSVRAVIDPAAARPRTAFGM